MAHIALKWNSDVCKDGMNLASTKNYSIQVGSNSILLKDLMQMSPDSCRSELAKLNNNESLTKKTTGRKRRIHSSLEFSNNFRNLISESGLLVDVGAETKRHKIDPVC